jgi:hypothetical protein
MRLIDADKIDFGKVFIGASDFAKDTREVAQKLIDEQPTAYDVDKVVKRLEDMKYVMMGNYGVRREVVSFDDLIEIVKSGGIE